MLHGHTLTLYSWSFGFLNDKKVTNLVEYEAMLLCEGASLPEIHLLKDFWRFYKDQARGRINKRPTARSLKANAKSFNAGFKRRTGNNVPAETIAEINLVSCLPYHLLQLLTGIVDRKLTCI